MSIIYFIANLFKWRRLKVGDKIELLGGYENKPLWLCGKNLYTGNAIGFIKGPYNKLDAIVKLDEKISVHNLNGNIIIMTLRFQGAAWSKTETVHIHLFDCMPSEKDWHNVDKDGWDKTHIESHATYRIIA